MKTGRRGLAELVIELLRARAPDASICPSEVARRASPEDFRARMADVRDVAAELVERGLVRVTRGADEVGARDAGGPIRIRRGPRFDAG